MLDPLAFFGGVPVAIEVTRKAPLLLRDPLGVLLHTRLGDQRQRRLLAFSARVKTEPNGDDVLGEADVKLPGIAVTR